VLAATPAALRLDKAALGTGICSRGTSSGLSRRLGLALLLAIAAPLAVAQLSLYTSNAAPTYRR